MSRDERYDILFEPVRIGPVTAKNRFFQVPHCTGMGSNWPLSHAAFRRQRAEGGWAVICTEETMIHPTSDAYPGASMRLWDDDDIKTFALAADAVHEHGSLFGVELVHGGLSRANRTSRMTPVAPSHTANKYPTRPQARGMDKADIKEFRRWHRDAAIRAKKAGTDVVYIYAAHNIALPMHFLLPRYNRRNDEYGGSLENRVRLLREVLEDTHEAIGDTCAVALRFAVDECMGADGLEWDKEGREVVEMLADVPDIWDVNISGWEYDSNTSRFSEEGYQEPYIAFVKQLTSKPVVGVGRYTSPDAMVAAVKNGVMDFIGAARPAIADPFLPNKIEEGRIDDIRECIGCNICVTGNNTFAPMRCTQNPVVGEEWRRGWHAEQIAAKGSDEQILIVGGGPAGLEAARALGQRGYSVTLAEREKELGGRLNWETSLPGLATWARVRDWRLGQIGTMANVQVYLDSLLDDKSIRQFGAAHVVLATGATWRRDGVGHSHHHALPGAGRSGVIGPEDVARGPVGEGPVVVYDDDQMYLGGVLAEKLARDGHDVTLVTPGSDVSAFTILTLEQPFVQQRLRELGVTILQQTDLVAVHDGEAELACIFTRATHRVPAATVVLVTSRVPNEAIYHKLARRPDLLDAAGIKTVGIIGDCVAPGLVAAAVHDGHLYARELDMPTPPNPDVPFLREHMDLREERESV